MIADDSEHNSSQIPAVWVNAPHKSWASMRCALFAHSAHFAKEFGDMEATARFVVSLHLTMRVLIPSVNY
jgi:hypothetical protein